MCISEQQPKGRLTLLLSLIRILCKVKSHIFQLSVHHYSKKERIRGIIAGFRQVMTKVIWLDLGFFFINLLIRLWFFPSGKIWICLEICSSRKKMVQLFKTKIKS